jgi:hypothetical protein
VKNLILFLTNKGICVLGAIFLISQQGCMFYYKAQTVKPVTAGEIRKYDSENKYFILHRDTVFWHLSGLEINDKTLKGNLTADVPSERWNYDITGFKGAHRYLREDRYIVLDQVHLYLKDSAVPAIDSGGRVTVVFYDIKDVQVYQQDEGRTTGSWALPWIITAGIATVIAYLIFANSFS